MSTSRTIINFVATTASHITMDVAECENENCANSTSSGPTETECTFREGW